MLQEGHRWPRLPCIAQRSLCYSTITRARETAFVERSEKRASCPRGEAEQEFNCPISIENFSVEDN